MKKIMISIAALVLAASCVNKVEVKTPEAGSGLKAVRVLGDETKVSYVDGTGFQWHEGEVAGLVAEEGCISSYDLKVQDIANDGFDATFYFEAEEGTYTLVHPLDPTSTNNAIKFGVPSVQEQEKPGFADTWFASRFPLIGKEPVVLEGEGTKGATASYKLVGSVVRFFIGGICNDAADYGEYLRSVTIETVGGGNLAGTIVTDNTGAITSVEGGSASVKVVTNQRLGQDKPGEGTGVYAVVTPVENAMVKYTVRTSYGTYTFTKATAVTWENGAKYDVVLNLAKAEFDEDKTPERLFAYGAATKAQWNVQDGVELTKQEDGTFKGTFALEQGKEFRFAAHRTNGEYTDNYGKGEGDTDLVQWVSQNDVPNFKVTTGTGLYDVTVNFETMTIALEQKAPYFIGDGTGWKFVQMTAKEGEEGVYFIESQVVTRSSREAESCRGSFTYTFDSNWEGGRFLAAKNDAPFTNGAAGIQIDGYPTNDWKWSELNPAYARMYIELNTKTATVKAWPLFYFVGDAVEAGWLGDWDTTFDNRPKFGHSETQNVVTWTGELKENGQLKFRTAEIAAPWFDSDHAWSEELFLFCDYNDPGERLLEVVLDENGEFEANAVGYTNGDHKWKIVTPGEYTVTLTFAEGSATRIKFHKNTVAEE